MKDDWWDPYRDQLPSVLYQAAAVYGDERYEALAKEIPGEDFAVSLLHLMSGIPIR